jgi:hypothetical protein
MTNIPGLWTAGNVGTGTGQALQRGGAFQACLRRRGR